MTGTTPVKDWHVTVSGESEKVKKTDSSPAAEGAASSPAIRATGDPAIDFLSPEFNRTDDLNDYSGNYRSFQPLDGIVTADMRHQMERRLAGVAAPRAGAAAPGERQEPEDRSAKSDEEVREVTVISMGRTLIIDNDPDRAVACGLRLGDRGLACTLLVPGGGLPKRAPAGLGRMGLLEGEAVTVSGGFGGFVVSLSAKGPEGGPGEGAGGRVATFDLVLDLQPVSAFAGGWPPTGYYAPGPDSGALEAALLEMPEMRGRFRKPQFISFRRERCLHGRSRDRDCRRCLDVCPIGAVRSVNGRISMNPLFCEGCGGCALVCPTDALRRVHPSPEGLLEAMRLEKEAQKADRPWTLVISDSAAPPCDAAPGADKGDQGPAVHFEVGQIGHVGLDLILGAFVQGAAEVVVACGPQAPPGIRQAVADQARMADALLAGLGLGKDKVLFYVRPSGGAESTGASSSDFGRDSGRDSGPAAESGTPRRPSAALPPQSDKRRRVRLVIGALHARTGAPPSWLPLPDGSPFGALAVDPAACTLCMACAVACPSEALTAGGDAPRLQFIEARCHQCGLCGDVCPEGAIRLLPGIHADPAVAESRIVLGQAEPVKCLECGRPFASQAMIDRMQRKLAGHRMYTGERQQRRLRLCGTCRAADALASEEMPSWIRR